MAKIYESGDILLKIDNLRKTTFSFYKAGDDEAIGELGISRPLKHLSLIVYKQFHDQTEESYTNIAKCYNQFVNAHSQFSNYDLFLSQFNPNPEQKLRHDLPFQLYAIKKDLNSPINLAREETLEELNRQGLPYYSYYDPDCFMNIKKGSKKLICENREIIKPFSGDYFKGYELYIPVPPLNENNGPAVPYNRFITLPRGFDEGRDNHDTIYVPDMRAVIEDSTGKRIIAPDNEQGRFGLIYENRKNVNMNLSAIKTPIKLTFADKGDINVLINTLKTVQNSSNNEISLEFYDEEMKSQRFLRKSADELISEFSKDNDLVPSK